MANNATNILTGGDMGGGMGDIIGQLMQQMQPMLQQMQPMLQQMMGGIGGGQGQQAPPSQAMPSGGVNAMPSSGGGMGIMGGNVPGGVIDAQGYKMGFDQKNSPAQLQSGQQQYASASDAEKWGRDFAMQQGLQSYHDQFKEPMTMGEMVGMSKALTPPQRPFREDMPIGFGARYIQQLLSGQ